MKNKGFTLIELMIVIACAGIFLAILVGVLGGGNSNSRVQYTITGAVEQVCISGYEFVKTNRDVTQVLDGQGKGIPCNSR